MSAIFLSAGVPEPSDPKYGDADPLRILAAVRALCLVTLRTQRIVWGGHPAITPMIWAACVNLEVDPLKAVHLYQSLFFPEEVRPAENKTFGTVTDVEPDGGRDSSLLKMRQRMLTDHRFSAGVFIGGKAGIEEEFALFREYQPEATLVVLKSTGGAAGLLGTKYPDVSDRGGDFVDYVGLFANTLGELEPEPHFSLVRKPKL